MNKQQLVFAWAIIIMLAIIVSQLMHISTALNNIDWDVRNILGKIANR